MGGKVLFHVVTVHSVLIATIAIYLAFGIMSSVSFLLGIVAGLAILTIFVMRS